MAARQAAKGDFQPDSLLVVIHDFVARSDDELSLAKGDRIELIEKDDDFGDGWYLGRHMGNARTGLFPEVYTTPAPKGTFANAAHNRRRSDGPSRPPQSNDGTAITMSSQQSRFPIAMTEQRSASASSHAYKSALPMAQMALRTSLPPNTSASRDGSTAIASPVMSETLSVIDEHMNDMNAPATPFVNVNGGSHETFHEPSVPPTEPLKRFSYIAGHETDEEEQHLHTEEEVMAWTSDRVAEYLEDSGVEKAHCNVFKEQEISGEVLLAMEQSSIFLKEFELGSVGRRLKTWHKIRALQDETRANAPATVPRSASEYSARGDDAVGDSGRNRASTMGSILPRALDTSRQSIGGPGRSNTVQSYSSQAAPTSSNYRLDAISPLQSATSMSRHENTYRPSAQHIREMQHSRRHSSIDSNASPIDSPKRDSHRKQPSIDQQWQPGQMQTNGNTASHSHTLSSESPEYKRSSLILAPSSPSDLDRGYFSSNELDTKPRNRKNLLTKKDSTSASPMHSRDSSYVNQQKRRSTQSGRVASGSMRDSASPMGGNYGAAHGIFAALSSVGNTFGSVRSTTSPQLGQLPGESSPNETLSPIVTKLDTHEQLSDDPIKNSSSPTMGKMAFFTSKPKLGGLRTISDAITKNEKVTASSPSPIKESLIGSPVRTGSTTPSTETRSFDMQKSEAQSRTSGGSATNLIPPQPNQRRPKMKAKKATSAYTRGLEKKTPADQMDGCDYSGWMKKKSGSLMTTWKTRLFVLRGRRLSYYYSDHDTEEKGLIDISFHRVLPAHTETLQGLHASMTGAIGSPASPKDSMTPTTAQEDLLRHPAAEGDDSTFIFKLVPPRSGLSKGVNFTRPTVHYFAVNSRQEGRLWMAALMKATIDRDEEKGITTSYKEKTISLAKARARRERPPALREDSMETPDVAELDGDDESSGKGLGIGGLHEKNETVAGAEELDASSLAPSTTLTTGTESEALNEKEAVPAS